MHRVHVLQLGLVALTPIVAHSEIYMTPERAVQVIFPGQHFTKTALKLSDKQAKNIEDQSDEDVRTKTLHLWVDKAKDVVFIAQVLGKHEFITFAVGVTRDGHVKGVEILEYREAYGQQVKGPWRKQFNGKTVSAPLKVGDDITNISGATLSSTHVTNGVRRLLYTFQTIKAQL